LSSSRDRPLEDLNVMFAGAFSGKRAHPLLPSAELWLSSSACCF
jgi:hypothetical protein